MSQLFSLSKNDFVKGLVVAVFSAILSLAYQMISQGGFSGMNYMQIIQVGVLAAIGYIIKNYLSDDTGKFLGKV